MNIANQERQIMNDGEIVNGIIEHAKTEHAATLENMAKLVHATWRDGMLRQGRPVEPQRLNWGTLAEEDRELDRMIARGIWERLEEKAAQFNLGYDCGTRDAAKTVKRLCENVTADINGLIPQFSDLLIGFLEELPREIKLG
jgi:hypothetical protein